MRVGLISAGVSSITVAIIIISLSPVDASTDSSWRYDAHGRSIDIDICIRCTSDVPGPPGPQGPPGPPGPPGPQGPPGDTHQTIVTLHDDAEGNAAGWNPPCCPQTPGIYTIQSPVDLEVTLSIEMTWVNVPVVHEGQGPGEHFAQHCRLLDINTSTDTFTIKCGNGREPSFGSTLTYIITKSEA